MTRTRSRSSFAIVLLLTAAMLPLQARAEDADTDAQPLQRIAQCARAAIGGGQQRPNLLLVRPEDADLGVRIAGYDPRKCLLVSTDSAKRVLDDLGHRNPVTRYRAGKRAPSST